ncbi:hypothetical protein NBRC116594_28080 [Shimia sp. NS0008-38b]
MGAVGGCPARPGVRFREKKDYSAMPLEGCSGCLLRGHSDVKHLREMSKSKTQYPSLAQVELNGLTVF